MIFRKTIPYLLCWCLCTGIVAQTPEIDSLKNVLTTVKLKDSEKAELLKNLSIAYSNVDSAKSRAYAFDAISLAQKIDLKRIEAAANVALSNSYYMNDTAKSRIYALKALRLAQNSKGLELQEGVAYIALGNYYVLRNQYFLSYTHYKKAEKILLNLPDVQDRLNIVYRNLLHLFGLINDIDNAMYYAEKLLEMAVERRNTEDEFEARYLIGALRFEGDREGNHSQEMLDYFLDLYQKAILLNSIHTDEIAVNCGELYILRHQPRKALPYLFKVCEFSEGNDIVSSTVNVDLAKAYASLHRLDSAEFYVKKAENLNIVYDVTRTELLRIRSLIESEKGNYRGALEIYKKYHHVTDSIAKVGKTAEISRMRNWKELEQKDRENEILQQEKQKQKHLIWILGGALAMIFVLLGMSVFFYRKTTRKNDELKKLNMVKDKLFSVVAHDLRSPIGSLKTLLQMANNNKLDKEIQARLLRDISVRVDDTFSLLDNLLRWAKSQMQGITHTPAYFNAQDEIGLIMDNLQKTAENKGIALNSRIGAQQVYADRDMFAVVVRNLTTNAIKYSSSGGEITLDSELKDNMLVVSVKDTGTGMAQEVQDKLFKLSETKSQRGTGNESGTGLGLVLCADFVKINGGRIWFTSTQGKGSTFFFSVPVKGNS